jgi:parvulin-like peptidyl-prolyl isomerase
MFDMITRITKANILVGFVFSFLSTFIHSQNTDDEILATVGDHKITLSEYDERYHDYLYSTGANDNLVVRKAILDNMINEILLFHYDSNKNTLSDPRYLNELEETRVRIILAYLKDREVYEKITVTEKEMREAFSRVNEKIAARHLFASSEEEAYALYELAKTGVDFRLLAKQVFTDSVLQNNGGYLGYFTWGDMDPAFEDAAYSLKIGEISPPVKTAYGYSIIKLEDRITNPLLTESEFQRKKPHLENVIKMRKKEPSERAYLDTIFDGSELTFYDETLRRIFDNMHSQKISESDNIALQNDECVKYRDRVYRQIDIERKISELPSYHKNRINSFESLKLAIEGMLLNDILYNIAASKGFDTTKVVLDKIEKYKMNLFLKYKRDEIINNVVLPDSIVFKYYKDNIISFSTEPEMNLQEILVENEELADSIIISLNEGGDFGELAVKYSLRKWSAENNGIMGYAPISKFGNYRNFFWDSTLGEVIGPIKIQNIFGIFKVLGKKASKPINFDKIKEEVASASKLEKQTDIMKSYLAEFRNEVNISINEDILESYKAVKSKF